MSTALFAAPPSSLPRLDRSGLRYVPTLILHAAAFYGQLLPWVEADAQEKERARHLRGKRPTITVKAPEHAYNGGPDLLYSVLPSAALETGLAGGKLQWAIAWLPSDAEGPIPSSDLIGVRSGRVALRLAPWAVSTLGVSTHSAYGWFLGYARGQNLSPGWQMGPDLVFWRHALELAAAMVVRQRFLPAVLETLEKESTWWPYWQVVYDEEDLARLDRLIGAMPVAARALRRDRRRRPQERPRVLMVDFMTDTVNHLVQMAGIYGSVWKHYPQSRRRKAVPIDERWVETLLIPDVELKGELEELIDLQTRAEERREAVFLEPVIEDVLTAPTIAMPSGGKEFWAGAELPADFAGPIEVPSNPGMILEEVGALPGWRGERPLHESLAPVYAAASRYALERVSGQKA